MPSSIRPGDVLADRYRLVDLLAESRGGRFWRAHDRVLERHVALHVIAQADERAEPLLDAARRSATVHERHLLRVLDADRVDGLCYVVNEWGSGDSLDIMLAGDGPLAPRRAAWLVSEVAASVAVGHDAGVSHGRLVPENVLVDHAGAVRLIGFAVDAALHGLPSARPSDDVADLGGLLYAALTGRWPGRSPSQVPPAHVEQGRVLRPRQVRAGIPRPLDALCDELVNPYPGHGASRFIDAVRDRYDLATARGIGDYLREFVGDPTGLAAAEAAAGHRDTTDTIMLPALPDPLPREPGSRPSSPPSPPTPPARSSEPQAPTPTPAPTEALEAPTDRTRPVHPVDPTEPTGSAEPAEPVDPAGSVDPAEPIDPAEPAEPADEGRGAAPRAGSAAAREAAADEAADEAGDEAGEVVEHEEPVAQIAPRGESAGPAPPPTSTELPTEAGLPIFDDEHDEVSWLTPRARPVPPPPPFEEPPERPLFAPDSERTARTPRRPTGDAGGPGEPGGGPGYWPWDSGTSSGTNAGTGTGMSAVVPSEEDEDQQVPGRSWLRLAIVIAVCLVLLLAIVVAYNLGRGRSPLGAVPSSDESTTTPRATASASATPVAGLTADDLDPQGSPPFEEHPELAPLAVDGKPGTAWQTMTYDQQLGPGGLKTGVGLVVDLGAAHDVSEVDLTFLGQPTSYALYVTDQEPTAIQGLTAATRGTADGTTSRAVLDSPATGRFVTVWLTSLPVAADGGYRGGVAEVRVLG